MIDKSAYTRKFPHIVEHSTVDTAISEDGKSAPYVPKKNPSRSAFIPKETGIIETRRLGEWQHKHSRSSRIRQANALNNPRSRKHTKSKDHTCGYVKVKTRKLLQERESLTFRIKKIFKFKR